MPDYDAAYGKLQAKKYHVGMMGFQLIERATLESGASPDGMFIQSATFIGLPHICPTPFSKLAGDEKYDYLTVGFPA